MHKPKLLYPKIYLIMKNSGDKDWILDHLVRASSSKSLSS